MMRKIQGCQIEKQHEILCTTQLKCHTTIYLWALKLSWVSFVLCKVPDPGFQGELKIMHHNLEICLVATAESHVSFWCEAC